MTDFPIDMLVTVYNEMKRLLCLEMGAPKDTEAMLFVRSTTGQERHMLLVGLNASPALALDNVLTEIRDDIGPMAWAVFIADSVIKIQDAPIHVERGDLVKAHRDGTDPNVEEAIVASFATNSGRAGVVTTRYTYTDTTGPEPQFGSPETIEDTANITHHGPVHRALRAAVTP